MQATDATTALMRDRLLRRLDDSGNVVELRGLDGSGRSTLLWSWLHSRGLNPSAAVLTAGTASLPDNPKSSPIIVVDARSAVTPPSTESIAAMLEGNPLAKIVLLLPPQWSLVDATAPFDVDVIDGADLSLTPSECLQFATEWGYDLDPAQAETLLALTGGWIKLVRYLLHRGGSPVDQSDASRDYFGRMVRSSKALAPHRAALQQLALLHSFSEVTIRRVARAQRDQEVRAAADRLRECGLLMRVRDDHLSLPHPLRTALLQAFEDEDPSRYLATAGAFAETLIDLDQEEALKLARDGERWDLIARLWAKEYLHLTMGSTPALEYALERLPREAVEQHPALSIAMMTMEQLRPGPGRVLSRVLLGAFDLATAREIDHRSLGSTDEAASLLNSVMMAERAAGDLDASRATAKKLRAFLSERAPLEPPSTLPPVLALIQEAVTELRSGDIIRSGQLAGEAVTLATSHEGFIAENARGHLALISARGGSVTNSLLRWLNGTEHELHSDAWLTPLVATPGLIARLWQAADEHNPDGVRDVAAALVTVPVDHDLAVFATEARVYAHLRFGEIESARRVLSDAPPGVSDFERSVLDRARIDTHLSAGDHSGARAVLREHSITGYDPSAPPPHWAWLPLARLQLSEGSQQALVTARAGQRDPATDLRDQVSLRSVAAVAASLSGDSAASEVFAVASSAEAIGLKHPWLIVPLGMLENLRGSLPDSELTPHLNFALEGPSTHQQRQHGLTEREMVVLHALSTGQTLEKVAQSLSVSINTIKKQSVSIYRKLGVNSREDAISVAHRHGLFG